MTTTNVSGTQWGDEGKGKIIDELGGDVEVCTRYSGGPNAGHTLVVNGEAMVLHILPSTIQHTDVLATTGPYVLHDLGVLRQELEIARRFETEVILDQSAPVILPFHRSIDALRERAGGKNAIGTTGRGIGPCYEDFTSRRGVQLGDLRDMDAVKAKLLARGYFDEKQAVIRHHNGKPMTLDEVLESIEAQRGAVLPYIGDVRAELRRRHDDGDGILFEGGQGTMLDIVHGGAPFCTSSFCTRGAVSATLGIHDISDSIGIAKAYLTRVGGGPFPTELDDEVGAYLQEKGKEFGSTTGRKRRTGWLDLRALCYACAMAGISEIALTKLDVLSGLKELQVCVGYKDVDPYQSLTPQILMHAEPIYEAMEGWDEDITGCERLEDLPWQAQAYVGFIEEQTGLPVSYIGTGPERSHLIRCLV